MGALSDILRMPGVQHALSPVVNKVLGRAPQPQAPQQGAQQPQQAPAGGTDPTDFLSDPRAYAAALSQSGAPLPYVLSRVSELVKQQKELADLTSKQLENKGKSYEQAGNILEGYLSAPTPENWKIAHGLLKNSDSEVRGVTDHFADGTAPTEEQLASVLAMTMAHVHMINNAKTVADTKAEEARTPGLKADSDIKKIELGYMQNADPAAIHAGIADAIDKAGGTAKDAAAAISAADLALKTTGKPAEAAAAAAKVIEGLNSTNTAVRTQNKMAPLREQEAADTASKLAPIKIKEAHDTLAANAGLQESISAAEANHRNALEQGDTATAKYYESLTSAKKAQATANTIQRVVELARSGSPLASQQLKAMVPEFTNAAQDIKRMGGTQSASMSSELDKAIGEIKSLGGGSTLSEDTINAIAPFVETIANGATAQHNANVQALKQAYPQKKFDAEALPHQSATGPNGHRIISHDGGNTWVDAITGKAVK